MKLADFSVWPGRFRNKIAGVFVLSLSLSRSLSLSLSCPFPCPFPFPRPFSCTFLFPFPALALALARALVLALALARALSLSLALSLALRYAQDNLGVKKVSAPSKKPSKCPIICFAGEKKLISRTFKISGALIVIVPAFFLNYDFCRDVDPLCQHFRCTCRLNFADLKKGMES
jgi:hypothetical protein